MHLTVSFSNLKHFSVTSEGLALFLEGLGLEHVRYLKGYANVIGKARELTESGKALAEVAIETSGHCAMREVSFFQYLYDVCNQNLQSRTYFLIFLSN